MCRGSTGACRLPGQSQDPALLTSRSSPRATHRQFLLNAAIIYVVNALLQRARCAVVKSMPTSLMQRNCESKRKKELAYRRLTYRILSGISSVRIIIITTKQIYISLTLRTARVSFNAPFPLTLAFFPRPINVTCETARSRHIQRIADQHFYVRVVVAQSFIRSSSEAKVFERFALLRSKDGAMLSRKTNDKKENHSSVA